jgi:polyphosphate glucokinase
MEVLGIDIGGTGVKGAVVDTATGQLVRDRFRLLTPQPATPKALCRTVSEVVAHFEWSGRVGCGFPGIIRQGVVRSAAHVSRKWLGKNVKENLDEATGCSFRVLNDADVAGLAEARFGAGKDEVGVVLLLTLGTGIGSALFIDGTLVPNTEFGHVELKGHDAEYWAADSVRKKRKLGWKKWARQVNLYLQSMEFYLSPDLIIIGGGVSRKHEKVIPQLELDARVVPAQLRNEAGIVGAAVAGAE